MGCLGWRPTDLSSVLVLSSAHKPQPCTRSSVPPLGVEVPPEDALGPQAGGPRHGGSRGTGPFSATFHAPGSSWGQVWATAYSSGPAFPPQACTWLARKTRVDFCLVGSRERHRHWAARGVRGRKTPRGGALSCNA